MTSRNDRHCATRNIVAATTIAMLGIAGTGFPAARGAGVLREAPSGFDSRTNGLVSQAEFDALRGKFDQPETAADGLGPVYNADSCTACHANPVSGGASQMMELRAGHLDTSGFFVSPPDGSLIHDRAISPDIQRYLADRDNLRSLRASPAVLGLGYVGAIDDATFVELAAKQAAETAGKVAGQLVEVPVLEAPGVRRIGRFGWKNQHASLLSFAADAYLNEMGITSRLAPVEIESMNVHAATYDRVPDPEDSADKPAGEQDIDVLATFIRATKAPEPDRALSATADARAGEQTFRALGCAVCHAETLTTAPAGTPINGSTFIVPGALGDKIIHPFSDFLLHDVGTGDGVPQGEASGAHFRTAPLWGLRTRTRFMHDGLSLTPLDAVLRHRGEALASARGVRQLRAKVLNQLLTFLRSR